MSAIELGNYLGKNGTMHHECLEECVSCLVACDACADACLDEPNVAELAACIRLDRDCADICAAAVRVMSRGGPMAAEMCRACAVACEACAAECERHAAHHEHCRVCAEACRRCADACRRMAASAA